MDCSGAWAQPWMVTSETPTLPKAMSEVLTRRKFDEVALSTLPAGVSRWLRQDIPHKVERKFNIPVKIIKTH